jgi:hypothetical protein
MNPFWDVFSELKGDIVCFFYWENSLIERKTKEQQIKAFRYFAKFFQKWNALFDSGSAFFKFLLMYWESAFQEIAFLFSQNSQKIRSFLDLRSVNSFFNILLMSDYWSFRSRNVSWTCLLSWVHMPWTNQFTCLLMLWISWLTRSFA